MTEVVESPMKIKALVPAAGGKRNLADTIVALFPKHRRFWDMFCLSLSVTFAKEPCVMETAVDLNGDLTNLARVLQIEDLALQLYSRAARTLMSESLFRDAADRFKCRGYAEGEQEPSLERAYDYLLCSWLGRNGCAGTQSYNQGFCVRYTANGGHAAKRWRSVIESIPAWHWRLMNVTILCRDVFGEIERIPDDPDTVIYLDPPYFEKGFRYIHDLPSLEEEQKARDAGKKTIKGHIALAEALSRFQKARVVLSYYDHPKLSELYPDWTQHKIEVSKALSHQGARGENNVKAVEVLLVNERPGTAEGSLFE